MLSVEKGIIDGSTEEGLKKIEELSKAAKERREAEEGEALYEIDEDDMGDLPVEGEQGKGKETERQ